MLFNSWEFLILLAATFALYYAPWSRGRHGKAWQVTVALVASVVFYGWEDPARSAHFAFFRRRLFFLFPSKFNKHHSAIPSSRR